MSTILDEHRIYLSDATRLEAFRRALESTIKPGDVVLDLASGTGILGLLACRAGAARVYAIEDSGLVGLAREIADANRLADRITVLREHSSRATLPEAVDCIVTDQIGHFGFEAGLLEYVEHARRWLKPGGVIVPRQVQLWITATECAEVRSRIAFWNSRPADLEFSPARAIARNSGYPVALADSELLAAPALLVTIDVPSSATNWVHGNVELEITRTGVLDGIGAWFVAELAPGVTLTNQPGHPERINRRNVVFPVSEPLSVDAGDRVEAAIGIHPAESIVNWTVRVRRTTGETITAPRATTFAGFLLSREDLARTAPDAMPRLTRAGEARKALLLLMDGAHTIDAIEHELQRAFPDLLPTQERAAEFVAEVVAGYAR